MISSIMHQTKNTIFVSIIKYTFQRQNKLSSICNCLDIAIILVRCLGGIIILRFIIFRFITFLVVFFNYNISNTQSLINTIIINRVLQLNNLVNNLPTKIAFIFNLNNLKRAIRTNPSMPTMHKNAIWVIRVANLTLLITNFHFFGLTSDFPSQFTTQNPSC